MAQLSNWAAGEAIARIPGREAPVDAKNTYWTLTVWESERHMKAFRAARPHTIAMRKLQRWCDEASYVHWDQADEALPKWPEAYRRLVEEGRLTPVAHPSPDHKARRFPKPRLAPLIGRELKPHRLAK